MHVTTEIFHKKFCSGIRVMFNWRRFFLEDWPIEIIPLQNRLVFSNLKLPWYMGINGFVSFNALDACPVCLSDIEEWYPLLPERQRNSIDEIKQGYLSDIHIPEFEFPAYAIPKSDYLIMDGNHRLSAIAMTDLSFNINMWAVRGPIEPMALADLKLISREQQ